MSRSGPIRRAAIAALAVAAAGGACRGEPDSARSVEVRRAESPAPASTVANPGPPAEEIAALDSPGSSPAVADPPESPEPAGGADPENAAVEPRVVPAGAMLRAELRTPLHSAITRPGDRFAARLVESVAAEGEVVVPAGTLIEGRVGRVVSADDPETTARIELDFRRLVLPSGERIPFAGELASPEARAAEAGPRRRPGEGVAAGAAVGAAVGGMIGESRRAAVAGAVVGAAVGASIVAAGPDREVVVPGGTPLPVVLREPLEIPR